MNKAALAERLKPWVTAKHRRLAAVNALLIGIVQALKRGESVRLSGVGNLRMRTKAARRGRNPMTGEKITIAARKVVRFKMARELVKDLVGA